MHAYMHAGGDGWMKMCMRSGSRERMDGGGLHH